MLLFLSLSTNLYMGLLRFGNVIIMGQDISSWGGMCTVCVGWSKAGLLDTWVKACISFYCNLRVFIHSNEYAISILV